MATKIALVGVGFALALSARPTEAGSREIGLKLEYSGSAMTHWDTNRDVIKPGMGILGCRSNLGRCTAQGIGHASVAGPATCPNGNEGIKLTLIPGTGHGVTRFDRTGDLLFTEISSETVCYDPSTGTQFKSGTERITGGTGRFAGATGQTQFEGTQWPLYVDADGNGFAAQTGTLTGTIILR